jgi:hypothetical protein
MSKWQEFAVSVTYHEQRGSQSYLPKPILEILGDQKEQGIPLFSSFYYTTPSSLPKNDVCCIRYIIARITEHLKRM